MKGSFAAEIYLAMSVIIIIVVLAAMLFNIFSPMKTVSEEETKDTYMLLNALKTAKLYTEASLDFSTYQAVYNNSKHGGYYDLSSAKTMTNELLPLCQKYMDKYAGCKQPATKDYGLLIHAGLKKGDLNTYPVGLLQCILTRLRRTDNGEVYYGLAQGDLKQIDCDFGDVTGKGLRGFQKDHGLEETGVVDEQTLENLRKVFESKWGDCSKFFEGCKDNIQTMVFWEPSGTPNQERILAELKKHVQIMMGKYTTEDYTYISEQVSIPDYSESEISAESGNGFLRIGLKSNDLLTVIREDLDKRERLIMRISGNITKEYPLRYMEIYKAAAETLGRIGNVDCSKSIPGDKINRLHEEMVSGFVINAEVFDKEDSPCQLIVKVSVKDTSKTFPVFNGKEASFEHVNFEFLVKTT